MSWCFVIFQDLLHVGDRNGLWRVTWNETWESITDDLTLVTVQNLVYVVAELNYLRHIFRYFWNSCIIEISIGRKYGHFLLRTKSVVFWSSLTVIGQGLTNVQN